MSHPVMMTADAEQSLAIKTSPSEMREFVQVVRFGVADENQARLIEAISGEVERWVRACPGFVSCQLHASSDGKYVLNYARWQTETAFHKFTKHPEITALNAAIRSVGPTSGPESASYHLMRCILPEVSGGQPESLVTPATS